MKICISGGAGFIGSYVANALYQSDDVFVIDNLITGKKENLEPGVKFIKADIISQAAFEAVKNNHPQVIFHFAALSGVRSSVKNYILDIQKNLLDSVNFLDYCLQCGAKKIIFASSGGTVYGNAKIIPTPEEYHLDPISPYGASKAACEFYLKILCQKFGADLLILRYANVYGPKQRPDTDAGVISIFANLMKKGEDVYIYGNGEQTRDYIHISDALNFTLEAFRKNLTGVFNVGTGVETSVNKIFNLLKDILNYKKAPIYKKPIYGEVLRSALNIQKIVKSLDIYPKMKIEEGIKTLFY